jgi:predicted metal-binding protein
MESLAAQALAFGFSHAAGLDAGTLQPREEVRAMCAADRCHLYGRSWMCPPACGSLKDNRALLQTYRTGLLVQTTGALEDDFDFEGMQRIGEEQSRLFAAFRGRLAEAYPKLLPLSAGGCRLCEACTYPDAPCRCPGEATQSMEAFGLVVSDACAANGLGYYYGPRTITYTGCYLLE